MNEVCNAVECRPGRPDNIKEKLATTVEMQHKAIELLSAIKRDVTGAENADYPIPVANCMDDVVTQSADRMGFILELICDIKDALGVTV